MSVSQRIAVTAGEPAGIGPDIVLMLALKKLPAIPVAVADPELLKERARRLRLRVDLRPDTGHANKHKAGTLYYHHVPLAAPVKPGLLDKANAHYVLETLKTAASGCRRGDYAAIVTAPVHKSIINDAGIPFSGHTEYLAGLAGGGYPVMMLAAKRLRVALVTTHLPLREVSAAITEERLTRTLSVLNEDLRTRFHIRKPVIAVTGLNPHAGEGGHLGDEEQRVIIPVLERMRKQKIRVEGPFAADTLFTPKRLKPFDAVLAMYHDQGLPVLKHVGFGEAVNITLGLPIIRTSVDHGTALDVAGTRKADPGSLIEAFLMAAKLAKKK
ncbi:MAG TPA: 4-hydroxythreonine-4-phosphate dehydrogenase PdxA [Gammaproteobacteria bacterium]|nr:4-hydroxythreonine-4-phosphate dehydrogenase PdxA [Gammaproteobacteria bacterium]